MRKTLMVAGAALLSFSACFASDHKAPMAVQKPHAVESRTTGSRKICEVGEMSVPGSEKDPCSQNDAACVSVGGTAYATCDHERWSAYCVCIVPDTAPMTIPPPHGAAGRAAAPSSCGDGLVQGGEQCDGTNLGGLTCKSLGFQAGQLACGPVCSVDTTNCRI